MGRISKTLALLIILFFLTSLVLLPHETVKAQTKTLIVPDQYSTIQDAINNASAGDTVYVKTGIYNITTEFFDSQLFVNKSISLVGENIKNTIILTTEDYNVVRGWDFGVEISGGASISGFTIVGNVNVMLVLDNAKVSNNIINLTGNTDGDMAIEALGSATTITSNIINSVNGTGVGSYQLGTCGFTDQGEDNTTFCNNVINGFGIGISDWSSNLRVFNNTLTNNSIALFAEENPALFYYNNILNCSEYSIDPFVNLNATYNWYGTTNAQTISQTIKHNSFTAYNENMSTYLTQYNVTFVPFLTEPNPQATPLSSTSSVSEFPALLILPLLVSMFAVAVVLRHRKTAKINQ